MSLSRGRAFPVLLLGAVLVASGCTTFGGTSIGGGPGVVITDFIPDLSQVFSGEDVRLQLRIQNQGEARATNVIAELTGIDLAEWGSFGGGFGAVKQLGDLVPFDPVTNTPGETTSVTFSNLVAPTLSQGIQFTYTPIVRVSYDYATVAVKPITRACAMGWPVRFYRMDIMVLIWGPVAMQSSGGMTSMKQI